MSKKSLLVLLITLCFFTLAAGVASARDIQFDNHTDFHWVGFYINYDGEGRHWGENLLSGQVDRGESVTLDVHRTNSNVFKIKIVERRHGEFTEVIWHDVNLHDADRVVMFYNRETGEISYRVFRN